MWNDRGRVYRKRLTRPGTIDKRPSITAANLAVLPRFPCFDNSKAGIAQNTLFFTAQEIRNVIQIRERKSVHAFESRSLLDAHLARTRATDAVTRRVKTSLAIGALSFAYHGTARCSSFDNDAVIPTTHVESFPTTDNCTGNSSLREWNSILITGYWLEKWCPLEKTTESMSSTSI